MKPNMQRLQPTELAVASALLTQGQLVGIPTETVYGLAANALDPVAVAAIFTAKGRPQDNPLIVHIAHPSQVMSLVSSLPPYATALMDAFWPGALTLVMPAAPSVPRIVTGGLDTVAVRCPSHPLCHALLSLCGLPLAAPSANLSGRPSPTTAQHVISDMEGRIAAVVDGGACAIGVESTVLDLTVSPPCLLRAGGILREQIESVLACAITVDTGHSASAEAPRSPGMKYKHYAPQHSLTLLRGTEEQRRSWAQTVTAVTMLVCEEEQPLFAPLPSIVYGCLARPETLMQGLFAALRQADTLSKRIVATYPEGAAFAAVQDRLQKAAGFQFEVLP